MPTTYKDQFYTIDPGNPPGVGTPVTVTRHTVVDNDDNGLIEPNTGDTWDGVQITSVWQGDELVIDLPGGGQITYVGVTYYLASGPAVFTPTDGQVLQDGTFADNDFVTNSTNHPVGTFGPTCFTPGTMIQTPEGLRAIETLAVGDLVETLDDGPQPVRHILRETVCGLHDHAPIRFAPGALDNDAVLMVSPQHRMLIRGWQAELLFGEDEVLVPAKHLLNGDTIVRAPQHTIDYIHLVFDAHQIIFAQGIPSESFFPGHVVAQSQGLVRAELADLVLDAQSAATPLHPVRPVLRAPEAAVWAA